VCNECDPRAPVFFLSYAHPDEFVRHAETSRELDEARFFDDLSENVAALVGRRAGAGAVDPGFMDVGMPGRTWQPTLLEKLGYCHSLIVLLSPSYVVSEWCSKEWDAFSRRPVERLDASGSKDHTAIFPVTWVPVARSRVPDVVNEVKQFSPGERYARLYAENGIFGLLRVNPMAYTLSVWRLAQQIASSYHSYHVAPLIVDPEDLRDIFRR